MSKKILVVCVVVITMLALLAFCCFSFTFVYSLLSQGYLTDIDESVIGIGRSDQSVAVIDIKGVISSQEETDLWGNTEPDMATETINKIQAAIDDDSYKAVLLRVNSPGGEVYATRRIYNKLHELKETGKPIVVLFEDTAASGAYYLSMPSDHIVASEMTLTGSIGVIFSSLDLTGLYEKVGIEEIQVVNSDGNLKVLKDLGDPKSEGYKLLQSVADDYYQNFVDVVAEGRSKTDAEVKKLADGRVYSGKQALNNGLVDSIGEMDEAISEIKDLADLDEPNLVLLENKESSFSNFSTSIKEILSPLNAITGNHLEAGVKAWYILQY